MLLYRIRRDSSIGEGATLLLASFANLICFSGVTGAECIFKLRSKWISLKLSKRDSFKVLENWGLDGQDSDISQCFRLRDGRWVIGVEGTMEEEVSKEPEKHPESWGVAPTSGLKSILKRCDLWIFNEKKMGITFVGVKGGINRDKLHLIQTKISN